MDSFLVMLFSQLLYDGYGDIGMQLAAVVKAHPACAPSDRLSNIVRDNPISDGKQVRIVE